MIYLPGILWAQTDRKHGFGTDKSWQGMLFKIHVFGVFTYITLVFVLNGIGMVFDIPELQENLFIKLSDDFNPAVIQTEIVSAIPLAIVMSICWLYVINYELIEKFLIRIKAIDPAKHSSVFKHAIETAVIENKLIGITNVETNQKYIGQIKNFSEIQGYTSVLLKQVTVRDLNDNFVKTTDQYYHSRSTNKFDFEIINQQEEPL